VIRKEIAESMINNFDLNQKEAAKKLGVTPAAVSQYFSKKRGKFKITDKEILEEIKISAERIILQENMVVIPETCRICRLLLKKIWLLYQKPVEYVDFCYPKEYFRSNATPAQ